MSDLGKFMSKYVARGACRCGNCFDAPLDPENQQPEGHTEDVFFFEVSLKEKPENGELLTILEKDYPQLLDGEEHGYMEIGGIVGDQGMALMLIGTGKLLDMWDIATPMLLGIERDDPLAAQMAGMGLVSILPKSKE